MAHDSKGGEKLAGWFHFTLGVLYLAAMGWHVYSAVEHWRRDESARRN